MCRMTETSFRWSPAIAIPLTTATWYVYERGPGEQRYSCMAERAFKPLYAIRIRAATTPLRERMANRVNQPKRGEVWQ